MFQKSFRTLSLVLLFGALSACQSIQFSPVSEPPSNQHTPGKFVWYDLATPDVESAKQFYGSLFGWTFETSNGYTLIRNEQRSIGGMLTTNDSSNTKNGRWVTSLSVADVDAAASQVNQSGGKILGGPVTMNNRGQFVFIADNKGAQLGLLRSLSGDPVDRTPRIGDWLWTELWSNDLPASVKFYGDLIGYQAEEVSADKRSVPYRLLIKDGKRRAGIAQIPWKNVNDQWVPYVRVADVKSITKRAEELGGKVFLKPDGTENDRPVALIASPNGAALMVEEWTPSGTNDTDGGAS